MFNEDRIDNSTTGGLAVIVMFVLLALFLILAFRGYILAPAMAEEISSTASWYDYKSCKQEGTSAKYTANGERFNHNALTGASWDYPFGTKLLITNLQNNKQVIIRINDRGPAKRLVKKGRIIDLSRAAFQEIANLKMGIIKVKIEKLKL